MSDYTWAIETLADCADGLDASNLRELIGELKGDPVYIMEQTVKKMETLLAERVESANLCPNCLTDLQARYKTCHSNGWSEPPGTWEEWDGNYCDCGWEE